MQPISILMIEHRIIERMIRIIKSKLEEYKRTKNPNKPFIESAVDFIRTYADQTHHGKEENILFRELRKKALSSEHKKTMNELIQEHITGRKTTVQLETAKTLYFLGQKEALDLILEKMDFLMKFYPKHIEKEDKRFFQPVMKYFSLEEQDRMIKESYTFDRKMIHRKYEKLVSVLEEKTGLTSVMSKNWLE
jgi:hemerythrin-like domain-containing protein